MLPFRKWFTKLGLTEHRLFLVGVVLKAIDGVLELGSGIAVLVLGAASVKHLLWLWTGAVLANDSDNPVAHHVRHLAVHLSSHNTTFAAVYLILHGALKLGLVLGMLRRITWAYPLAAAFLTAFIGYQVYRLTQHFSLLLIVLSGIDVLIVVLILLEYRRLRRSAA